MGACMLASKACLMTGAGLVTAHIPISGLVIMQTSVPEVMCQTDSNSLEISSAPIPGNINAIGIGCGMGTFEQTQEALYNLIQLSKHPLVLDADALNILSQNKEWLQLLPENTILTPHPKEFERLTGTWKNDYERLEKQIAFSKKHDVIVVLKGAHTSISTTNGHVSFNSTGNVALATAGSGDVLTGIITGLLAQGYSSLASAQLGVYLHGLAADLYQKEVKSERMIASTIIDYLHKAIASTL